MLKPTEFEYLYVGLQDKSYFNPAASAVFASNQRVSLDDHIVRVSVNYKLPWSILEVCDNLLVGSVQG